ncbi:MAG: hypothetical protein IKV48_00485, partial [Eggerthellaceae bacterium]|nr:hypothetical protein [Eggerthellaceae bacterium]
KAGVREKGALKEQLVLSRAHPEDKTEYEYDAKGDFHAGKVERKTCFAGKETEAAQGEVGPDLQKAEAVQPENVCQFGDEAMFVRRRLQEDAFRVLAESKRMDLVGRFEEFARP